MTFVFITGASGAGKTAVLNELRLMYPADVASFYHMDDIDVPGLDEMTETHGSPEQWQEHTLHQWLNKLLKVKSQLVFFEGSFSPDFLLTFSRHEELGHYHLFCLSADAPIRKARLTSRGQAELATPEMETFARFLEARTQTLNGIRIDTTQLTPQEVALTIDDAVHTNTVC